MNTIKNIKPVYLYLIGTILGCIAGSFRNLPAIYYPSLILGLIFILWGIAKYFTDKK